MQHWYAIVQTTQGTTRKRRRLRCTGIVMRPGPGWKNVAGPVWDHVSGVRLHMSGLVRMPDGNTVSANEWPQSKSVDRAVRITGSRRRGLMVWALWVLSHRCEFDEVYYIHERNYHAMP